jgi:hypothetical protein
VSILSVAERVREYLSRDNKALLSVLETGQYFEISESVMDAVDELAQDITKRRDEDGHGMTPEDARLPARPTIIWFSTLKDNLLVCHEPRSEEGRVRVLVLSAYMDPLVLGDYEPGSPEATINEGGFDNKEHAKISKGSRAQMVVMAAAILSTINAPRITKRVPAGTRQNRRAAMRRVGATAGQWHRIEWDLSKPRVARGEREGAGWHMPLHYTRGYWRKGEEGRGKAVERAPGVWATWVDGYWSGHPAYGIKRAVYAPRIGEKGARTDV